MTSSNQKPHNQNRSSTGHLMVVVETLRWALDPDERFGSDMQREYFAVAKRKEEGDAASRKGRTSGWHLGKGRICMLYIAPS
jgi:hypothetical protein